MKKATLGFWLRGLALCTALGLGGTFVWTQQKKAAPATPKPEVRAEESAPTTPLPEAQDKRVVMPGSKSIDAVFKQEAVERTLMPSSKSGIFDPKGRAMMPSSKSLVVPPQESQKADP